MNAIEQLKQIETHICRHSIALHLLSFLEENIIKLREDEDFQRLAKAFSESSAGDYTAEEIIDRLLEVNLPRRIWLQVLGVAAVLP